MLTPIKDFLRPIYHTWVTHKKVLPYRRSYSQQGEDMILALEFADRLYANSGGFYVDVGAFHPEHYSTTQYFYLQGWRGINIDAMPERMKLFQQLRPEDTNLEMGVSQVRSKLTYHLFDYPNMSTCCEETAHRFLEQGRTIITQQEVETYPLAEILEKYLPKNQSIDFLNIDVEGLDYQVLNSNDWNQYRPHIVLVEDLDCLPIEQICDSRILQFMKEQGYELMAKTLFTLIFKNKYLN